MVWFNSEKQPIWTRFVDGKYQIILEDEDGMIKCTSLPGLWIPIKAIAERDWWSVLAKISPGITRRGHRDFMATLWN
jgi:hypothetical protein